MGFNPQHGSLDAPPTMGVQLGPAAHRARGSPAPGPLRAGAMAWHRSRNSFGWPPCRRHAASSDVPPPPTHSGDAAYRARTDRVGLLRDFADPAHAVRRTRGAIAHPATHELARVGLSVRSWDRTARSAGRSDGWPAAGDRIDLRPSAESVSSAARPRVGPAVAIHDSSTRRCRSSSLTSARFDWSRSFASSKVIPRSRIRYAASTVADRPRPFAQWTSTVRPSASCASIHATASVSTSGPGTVTSGTRYCRWTMSCASKKPRRRRARHARPPPP